MMADTYSQILETIILGASYQIQCFLGLVVMSYGTQDWLQCQNLQDWAISIHVQPANSLINITFILGETYWLKTSY